MSTRIYLTTTGTNNWTVPSDWSVVNTIEVIGAGGDGGYGYSNSGTSGGGGAGAGGGYGKITNIPFTTGSSISYTIANHGTSADSFFNGASLSTAPVGAAAGGNGVTGGSSLGGAGGGGGIGKGGVTFSGGGGGAGGTDNGGGGGGGAGGLNGGGGGGIAAGSGTGGNGGNGDNGYGGAGGTTGLNGGNGIEYSSSPAYGSGGGGGGASYGGGVGNGGTYGSGGGGGWSPSTNGTGTQGIIIISYTPAVPNPRYWVGGTGTWDATTTTHWSATSGGAGGATVPVGITTAVFFDANSGGGTVTLGANYSGIALSMSGYTGTLAESTFTLTFSGNCTFASTYSGTGGTTVGGNITLTSGMTWSNTGTLTLNATSSGKTITTNAVAPTSPLVFNGAGGAWSFASAPTVPSITLTAGSLTLYAGTNTLTGTGTVWSAATGQTLVTTGSTIKIDDATSASKTFAGGGYTYNNIYLTGAGTGTFIVSGSNTFQDFKCDTPPHTIQFTEGTTQTLNTFTVNGTSGNLMTLQSTTNGVPWYLVKSPAGQISCDYLSLQDSHVS